MAHTHVYKILSAADWSAASESGFSATALDEGDGYVHLSTSDQVGETLALHYKQSESVRLLEYLTADLKSMGEIRWEPSRGGQLFPHLYGRLKISVAKRAWVLDLDSDNVPILPDDL